MGAEDMHAIGFALRDALILAAWIVGVASALAGVITYIAAKKGWIR